MQASGAPNMLASIKTTLHHAGVVGLWDGITGTLLRQFTYSLVRFAAYEDLKVRLPHLAPALQKDPRRPGTLTLALAGGTRWRRGRDRGQPCRYHPRANAGRRRQAFRATVQLCQLLRRAYQDRSRRGARGARKGARTQCHPRVAHERKPARLVGSLPGVTYCRRSCISHVRRYDWAKGSLIHAGMKDDIRCHSIASFVAVSFPVRRLHSLSSACYPRVFGLRCAAFSPSSLTNDEHVALQRRQRFFALSPASVARSDSPGPALTRSDPFSQLQSSHLACSRPRC